MKNVIFFLLNLAVIGLFAQSPQAIKYQAVARNTSGNILVNQVINMRIGILSGGPDGTSLYQETHTVATNAYGLVNLEIGRGTLLSGNFSTIQWGQGSYFVKVEVDENGGNNFSLLGVSQLLSVPYALHANTASDASTAEFASVSNYANSAGILKLTDEQRDTISNPPNGMIIYNLTTFCLNFYRNDNWFQLCGDCVPQPSIAYAGPDIARCADTVVQLNANPPEKGTGTWSVLGGDNNDLSDIYDPHAILTGHLNQVYTLLWQVATSCSVTMDYLQVAFNQLIPANAGADQHLYDNYLTFLNANFQGFGNIGQWTIMSGSDGYLGDYSNPYAYFQGVAGESYTLRWTTWNDCDTSFDDVIISFCTGFVAANAGADIPNSLGYCAQLQGNSPGLVGISGRWSVITGSGGTFADSTQGNTLFTGLPGTNYELKWTLTSACDTTSDNVIVNMNNLYSANAGPDQYNHYTYYSDFYTVTLAGNNPGPGISGQWSILSGSGGNIVENSNPNTEFQGIRGESYTLLWTIWNDCGTSIDEVSIRFCPDTISANAGQDIPKTLGYCVQLQANSPAIEGLSAFWSVSVGSGGTFSDPGQANAIFTGLPGMNYELKWTITSICDTFSDIVAVNTNNFYTANAGPDQYNHYTYYSDYYTVTLAGNNPGTGISGQWSILSGSGGNVADFSNPGSEFQGMRGESYTLLWIIWNDCGTSSDEVSIRFCPDPITANAGEDIPNTLGHCVQLQGNTPAVEGQTGSWSVNAGSGGSFSDPNQGDAIFTGLPGTSYVLQWTITSICDTSIDFVNVTLNNAYGANAGPDQQTYANNTYLAGNDPGMHNYGEWTIISGSGGEINDISNPNTYFQGIAGESYTLR
ncbi:MAG: hypothetical protein NTU44_16970, partial [Bacteroidetes bacterium]|nr:hypothetical protein [Bacteroidota bacterium]